MIVNAEFQFRARRDPYPYDFTDGEGNRREGVAYSIEVMDHDEAKGRIKLLSKDQWDRFASTPRGTLVTLPLEVGTPKIATGGELKIGTPAPQPAGAAR